jgi:hypothetical protein
LKSIPYLRWSTRENELAIKRKKVHERGWERQKKQRASERWRTRAGRRRDRERGRRQIFLQVVIDDLLKPEGYIVSRAMSGFETLAGLRYPLARLREARFRERPLLSASNECKNGSKHASDEEALLLPKFASIPQTSINLLFNYHLKFT